jgi:hypothetical protein
MECAKTCPTAAQVEATRRLWAHANSGDSKSHHTAAFLLSLYNGSRYPISLSSLRLVDGRLYLDCVRVLEMHYHCEFFDALPGVDDEDFTKLARAVHARQW